MGSARAVLCVALPGAVLLDHPESNEIHASVSSVPDDSICIRLARPMAALRRNAERREAGGIREEMDARLARGGWCRHSRFSGLRSLKRFSRAPSNGRRFQ